MKKLASISAAVILAVALASCGGSAGSSSSSGMFGKIPATIARYENESKEMKSSMNKDNYEKQSKKLDELRDKTVAEVEAEAEALSGKEIKVSVDEACLKIEHPVTLVFTSMNKYRAVFSLGGTVVAATDLTLNVDSSDLTPLKLLGSSNVVITVKMPVAAEFLDKEGNVVKSSNDIGILPAENLGTSAVVKAGTPVDFCRTFTVDDKMEGVESVRLIVDLTKAPYTSRGLAN